ncbi:hypothetical protein [Mycolicibacterium peregrinum]
MVIRPILAGVGISAVVSAIVGVAFYYGIWPISVILDQDPNHPV